MPMPTEAGALADMLELERQSKAGQASAAEEIRRRVQADDQAITAQVQQLRLLDKYQKMLASEMESLPEPQPQKTFDPGLREQPIMRNGQVPTNNVDIAATGGPQPAQGQSVGFPQAPTAPEFLVDRTIEESGPVSTPVAGGAFWLPMRQPTRTVTQIRQNALTAQDVERIRIMRDEQRFDSLQTLVNNGADPVSSAEVLAHMERGNVSAAGEVLKRQPNLALDQSKLATQLLRDQIRSERASLDMINQSKRLEYLRFFGDQLASGKASGFGSLFQERSAKDELGNLKYNSEAMNKIHDNLKSLVSEKDGEIRNKPAWDLMNGQLLTDIGYFYSSEHKRGFGPFGTDSVSIKQSAPILASDVVSWYETRLTSSDVKARKQAETKLKAIGFKTEEKNGQFSMQPDSGHSDYRVLQMLDQHISNIQLAQEAAQVLERQLVPLTKFSPPPAPGLVRPLETDKSRAAFNDKLGKMLPAEAKRLLEEQGVAAARQYIQQQSKKK
jgi:hypothetical protein